MKKAAGYLALFSTISALSLSGCGTATKQEADSEAKADTYVTLRAITVGTMPENGMDEFYEELDDMTEELGCHLFHGEMNVHRSIWRLLPVSMILSQMVIFRIIISRQQKVHF